MSMIKSVGSLAYASREPPLPAGTMAALSTIKPCVEIRVSASGRACPVGEILMTPKCPRGSMVTFSEYACAVGGIVQAALVRMAKVRLADPLRLCGPNEPVNARPTRVSTRRQGVIPTNTRGAGVKVASSLELALRAVSGTAAMAWLSACVGCQYSGACQFLRGA